MEDQDYILGKTIPLTLIEGEFCRVTSIMPMSYIDAKGKIRSDYVLSPYGFLPIESPNLPKDGTCYYPIRHKDDFKHVAEAFKEMDSATQEIIIVYQDNPYKYNHNIWLKLFKTNFPKLHVFIYEKGIMAAICDKSKPANEYFDTIHKMRIKEWEPIEGLKDMA